MEYRVARSSDLKGIAGLHADSWRRNYRGAYLDSFLDGDVVTDRMVVWADRLSHRTANQYTVVAQIDGAVAGFAHTIFDADPTWGALLDNLHVSHDLKRQGIGARLMAETARAVIRSRSSSGLYVWVLEQNTPARAFYTARGGTCAERELAGPFPGGGHAISLRYTWQDLPKLAELN